MISAEFEPLELTDVPQSYDREICSLTPEMVALRIRKMKKPKSTVPGDIPPNLLTAVITSISEPLYYIFNAMPRSGWPQQWKTEFQTVIPKKTDPVDPNECRNLACTNFFSKILESFVLEGLQSEVSLSSKQYGGVKHCGVNHFLLHMWDKILVGLEENQSAATLMSVDFSKAFNRMKHQECLGAIARKGGSTQTILMIYHFLKGRQMHIRDGQLLSTSRNMTGGAPQGTKLGNFLFCR